MGKIIKVHFGSNYLFKNNICIFLVIKLHILTVKKKKRKKVQKCKVTHNLTTHRKSISIV